jgi:parallel beta-helix repeat protein
MKKQRTAILAATAVAALGVPVALAWPSLAATVAPGTRTLAVSSATNFATAVAQARPGDRILLADGVYSTPVHITRSGTAAAPITIAAQNVGGATITRADTLQLAGVKHVVIQGFTFADQGALVVPVSAAAVRITRNTFQSNKSGAYLSVSADDTEVDHNTFQNKKTAGVYLQVNGPGAHGMAQRVHVHHNYFFNHQFKGSNGGESIRFGLSGRQHASAHGLIEYNLFEKADGDSEAISVKSSDNIVRYNTLINSRGTISLRHGWNTLVEGNFVLGGRSGIRFFGNNHTIINNVVEDTSGQPLEVGGGELRDDTKSQTDHEAADHCLVAFNTFEKASGNVVIFGHKQVPASDITLADNIILGSGRLVDPFKATDLHFLGNLLNGGTAGMATGFKMTNPQLTRGAGNLLRPSAGSPAIDAATGSFPQVTLDMDGQTRTGAKDVGADEFGAAGAQRVPLTTADVGPKAP